MTWENEFEKYRCNVTNDCNDFAYQVLCAMAQVEAGTSYYDLVETLPLEVIYVCDAIMVKHASYEFYNILRAGQYACEVIIGSGVSYPYIWENQTPEFIKESCALPEEDFKIIEGYLKLCDCEQIDLTPKQILSLYKGNYTKQELINHVVGIFLPANELIVIDVNMTFKKIVKAYGLKYVKSSKDCYHIFDSIV